MSNGVTVNSELERQLKEVKEKYPAVREYIDKYLTRDPLTGLYSRGIFDDEIKRTLAESKRIEGPLSLIMLDLDNFKPYNDIFGHIEGDKALKRVAEIIQNSLLRQTDIPCRYGGDEFGIILPHYLDGENSPEKGSIIVASRILNDIRADELLRRNQEKPITASIGIATTYGNIDPENFKKRADSALYAIKQKMGGNGILHYMK
jgi:diguanylate cyclase (GGDEF)-like protein